jgi:hypothetical protein
VDELDDFFLCPGDPMITRLKVPVCQGLEFDPSSGPWLGVKYLGVRYRRARPGSDSRASTMPVLRLGRDRKKVKSLKSLNVYGIPIEVIGRVVR